jgi:ABC-type dipeptide/oligopeptide/nickel transport system ATPase component
MRQTALSVKNLSVCRRQPAGMPAVVRQLSFQLGKGEILALVGESGCGKTKSAEAIMGLLSKEQWQVTSDLIELNGVDLNLMPAADLRKLKGSEISMVFQEPLSALDPVFSCGYQLSSIIQRHLGAGRHEAGKRSLEMLRQVSFADPERVSKSYPHQLSGGMRQRVMIAMAMVCRPAVLIADEPTTALDVTTQAQVLDQLTRLGREFGTAILLITHDLGVVAQYADRAMIMLNGKVVEEATVSELFAKPQHACTKNLMSVTPRAGI